VSEAGQAELLAVAEEAALAAGALLRDSLGTRFDVTTKSTRTDPVSEADHAAERVIRELLAQRRPRDVVLGEEGGEAGGQAGGVRWIVDPLDGTVNYLYAIPHWGVSIACEDAEGPLAGVVHDPLRGETFSATRDGPATLDGTPVSASTTADLGLALVATGFSYEAEVRAAQAEVARALLPRVRDLRRLGSAAIDLAWAACGRFDAFYERGLQPWDRAAGELICARAGLASAELAPADGLPGGLVVAPPALLDELLGLVAV